ncbi:MAG: sterol desaturase family protein [Oligoflexus sp.]
MNLIIAAVPIFIFLILTEILFNHIKKMSFYRVNDAISNVSAGVIQQVLGFIPIFFEVLAYLLVFKHFALAPEFFGQQVWWMWVLLFFMVDFQYYWFHRFSHRINILWTGHVVHHQSEEYNLTVALRQSILQRLYSIPFALPFAVLGVDLTMLIIVSVLNTLSQFWVHTRLIDRLPKVFEAFLNTPSHHRVHHGRNPQYIDKNYAGAFIIWDRLFGTFEPEKEEVIYGVTVPTKTWNPLSAQIITLTDLWQKIKASPRWQDKARYLVKAPGWHPETGEVPVQMEVREKYDPVLSGKSQLIAVGGFVLTLGLSVIFLIFHKTLPLGLAAALLLAVLGLLTAIGLMMDREVEEQSSAGLAVSLENESA